MSQSVLAKAFSGGSGQDGSEDNGEGNQVKAQVLCGVPEGSQYRDEEAVGGEEGGGVIF